MAVYSVSYDLNKSGKDYDGLIKKLKTFDNRKILKSHWLLATNKTADQIWNDIQEHFDADDMCLINRCTNDRYGILTKEHWEWFDKNV